MRRVDRFNDGWKFHKGDAAGAEAADFDDGGWRTVTLPHDWGIEGPFDPRWASATGYLPGGVGWYRKTFQAPASDEPKQIYVHFDGVYCNSEVWINGHLLGRRPNGFVSFRYDLTPHLHVGGQNTLAVRVDHRQFADCRWYTGSGIYRNVYLVVADPLHIALWGVFATTPVVTADEAQVRVEVSVQNHSTLAADVRVENTLRDAEGNVVAQASAPASVSPGEERSAESRLEVTRPRLWSPERPDLYVLRTEIRRDGQVVDAEETRMGIRHFHFDPDQGFFLNGENLKLKGVCLHDDAGALGVAVPAKVWERRLRRLKAAGANAVRMAHNPHMPELYDLCDELGFLVQDEAFDEWEGGKNKWIEGWNAGAPGKDGYSEHFAEWAEIDLRDLIRRDRNHPSIIMWSIGNEIDYPNDPYTHPVLDTGTNPQSFGRGFKPDLPHADRLGEVARQLVGIVKALDDTRPVTAALAAALISNETEFADALDIVGYNYQEYRYAEDHARYSDRVIYGSENSIREDAWRAVADNPFISGQFLWTGIDYLGEARQWPFRSSTPGLLDLAGRQKPEYYLRQSLWTAEPMIYLATRDVPDGEAGASPPRRRRAEPVWDGTPGQPVRVVCFTNCERAELFLNDRSLGVKDRESAENGMLFWDVPYEPGTLRAEGGNGDGTAASWTLATAGPPRKLLAEADADVWGADGVDLVHVEVTVTDENGVPVYAADTEIHWTIEGPARLLGLESGDPASHEDYQSDRRKAFHGRLLGYVQSTEESGAVTIRLRAPGLEDATVRVRSE